MNHLNLVCVSDSIFLFDSHAISEAYKKNVLGLRSSFIKNKERKKKIPKGMICTQKNNIGYEATGIHE